MLAPFAFLPTLCTLYSEVPIVRSGWWCSGCPCEEPVHFSPLLPLLDCSLPGTADTSVAFRRAAADPKPHSEPVSFP